MMVEIVSSERFPEEVFLVQRIDNCGHRFWVKTRKLARFGSHDPESGHQIQKRMEFEKLEELLAKKDCTIEKMEEDGNCLF